MAGEGVKVAIQCLYVGPPVYDTLAAVHQYGNAAGVGEVDDPPQVGHSAQYVGCLGHRDDAGTFVDQSGQQIEPQGAFVVERQYPQFRSFAFCDELPRNEVGMVFHLGDEEVVPFAHESLSETGGYQIDGLRGAAGEYDFPDGCGVEQAPDLFPRGFVACGGLFGHVMDAPVYVGVQGTVQAIYGADDGFRFLGRGRGIQIDQRFAVHRGGEDRKVRTYF